MDDPRPDSELVRAAQRGDAHAFEALYRRHRDWAVRVAYRFAGERHLALDAMQEAFLYLLRKLGEPGFTLTARLTTFLYPAVKHAAQDARRKSARAGGGDDALLALPAGPEAPAEAVRPGSASGSASRGGEDDLSAVLARLPAEHREVVLLRFVDDLSLGEIAEALGLPVGTVKSRLHHALRKLRDDPVAREYFEPA